ncbi:MAG TPA: hypothetical protein VFA41_15850 [Ktedonobacteraceae bacterium]|jgi:hypothetical protein|nr:hypothetical protein [Ktedonobacteraceae bacterium]
MLVTMKRQTFDSLDDAALANACIEPTVEYLHADISRVKSHVLTQLTPGQQALFLFRAFHDHAGKTASDLYFWVSSIFPSDKMWRGTQGALRYFGDEAMLQLLQEITGVVEARQQQSDIQPWELEADPAFFALMSRLNEQFHELVPATFERMGKYIRSQPDEFVVLED